MKRFFCTICKRVKRTQHFPINIKSPLAPQVTDRIGECNSHTQHTRRSLARFTNESLEQIEGRFNRSSLKKVVNK